MSSAGIATLSPILDDPALSPIRFDGSRSPHCSTESILIYLAVPGSPVIPMQILESDSIASVKLRIQHCNGFFLKKQKLVFGGKELARNDSLVRDYGVADGNVLHLAFRISDLRVITVETTCGKKFEFQVERSRNIGYVKQQIAKRGKDFTDLDDLNDQKLICNGEELDDQKQINDICKKNEAVIHLLIRKPAKVRANPIKKEFELVIVGPDIGEKEPVDVPQVIPRKPPDGDVWIEPFVVNPEVELSPMLKDLIRSSFAGLEKGNPPVMSSEGSGGAYFMQDISGRKYVAVFKPIDEEPMAKNNPRGLPLSSDGEGLKRGTRVGEGALREVAAYILDHPVSARRSFLSDEVGFSGVPPTVMVRCLHGGFNRAEGIGYEIGIGYEMKSSKVGSLQMFVENCGSCEDMGPRAFPVEEVHKISVLDIRLANADRHAGNILVSKEGEEGSFMLIPIDHGYCLPENFEDCTFEWLYWPQSRQPFNSETINYIRLLDAEEDIALLNLYGWEPSLQCSRTLRISTMLLKKGAERGLTPYDIGSILCRETLKKESKIEEIIREAENAVLPGTSEAAFLESVADIMDAYLGSLELASSRLAGRPVQGGIECSSAVGAGRDSTSGGTRKNRPPLLAVR